MKNNTKFQGAWPTLPTPYHDDLTVDYDAYRTLLKWYLTCGIGGLYANCLSSEMYHLEPEERLKLIEITVETSDGKAPVAATGNLGDTLEAHISFCKQVAERDVDVVMLVVPTFCDTDDELEDYYLTIAEHVDAPLGFYECPVPRSFHLSPELVGKLAHTGRFVTYKETSSNIERHKQHLSHIKDTPLALLQSNTFLVLDSLRAGATGSMTIGAIWVPDMVAKVIEAFNNNDPNMDHLQSILCTMKLAQRYVHPWGTRYLMSKRGLPITTICRSAPKPPGPDTILGLDYAAKLWFDEKGELIY